MNATCSNCLSASKNPTWGGYTFTCLGCCARLVVSAHPDKGQAASQLGSIARFKGAPERKDILAAVKALLAGESMPTSEQGSLL